MSRVKMSRKGSIALVEPLAPFPGRGTARRGAPGTSLDRGDCVGQSRGFATLSPGAAMKLAEYSAYDALGLAELVARKEVSPKELAQTAAAAREKIDGTLNAVVYLYPDRIADLDERTLGNGPFRKVRSSRSAMRSG